MINGDVQQIEFPRMYVRGPIASGDPIAVLRLSGLGQRRYASLLAKVCTPLILG